MKRILFLSLIVSLPFISFCQQEVSLDSVQYHVGDIVKVCAKIYGTKYLKSTKSAPTFLNAGANYPNALLTILIWGDKRDGFTNAPEIYYNGKDLCVTGKITLYKGKPEIIVNHEDQIELK